MTLHTLAARATLFTLCLCGSVFSQQAPIQTHPVIGFGGTYIGDLVSNVSGGKKAGSCFMGMATLTMDLESSSAGLPPGGTLFLKAVNTHGARASETLVGDFQVLSNIEAGEHTYFQELWYRQAFGPVSVIVGLQDMNTLFAVNAYSGLYLNSSFGVHSTIASNLPAPIFPLTSIAGAVVWNASDRFSLLAAVHDGNPIDFSENPYNLKWHLSADDGVLSVSEAQFSTGEEHTLPGMYKFGVYVHDHHPAFADPAAESDPSEIPEAQKNYGIYCTMDQMVRGRESTPGSIAVFARASLSPRSVNDNHAFVGAGVNYYGLFHEDGSDVIGVACAHARLASTESETAFELTYQTPITENLTLQPDFQYIVHPAGGTDAVGRRPGNAIAATLRFGIQF